MTALRHSNSSNKSHSDPLPSPSPITALNDAPQASTLHAPQASTLHAPQASTLHAPTLSAFMARIPNEMMDTGTGLISNLPLHTAPIQTDFPH
ncbi:hypothetical protein AVEN_203832-1 [Araneus ventricosus]|uniref:Uncharacterized protein n=1 Tax=Araneus ventricosus TaxID=182803 RepID=A0A4Y2HWG3_ARAVE|nr:hypothetical protein AVEN_203832-1 [Araneus ventricosus]